MSGRVFWHGPPALSKLQLAPIFANIVDSEGRETGKGSYLRIRNYSSTDTVFITSMATGDHRMLVGPEETYRPYISTYKTPGQQTTADLEVTYCSRRY